MWSCDQNLVFEQVFDPLRWMTRALCKMKEKRPVLRRSMLILFTKNLFLQRTERPAIETSVIQARSSDDSKDPNVEKEHERTRRLVTETHTQKMCRIVFKHVRFMKAKRSTLEIKHSVRERRDPLLIMRT